MCQKSPPKSHIIDFSIELYEIRWALLAHTSDPMAREVHAEKKLKENTKEISAFISAIAPCAQLSYRYIYAHLHTFPMHGIGSKMETSAYSASCPSNDA